MKILIVIPGHILSIEVVPETKILDLKTIISSQHSLAVSSQRLFFFSSSLKTYLRSESPISAYPISERTEIYLELIEPLPPVGLLNSFPWSIKEYSALAISACTNNDIPELHKIITEYEQARAVELNTEDVTKLLDHLYQGKWNCLHYSCHAGLPQIVDELIDLGADINSTTKDN